MLEILNKYYEDGYLIKQTHPTKDLTIWNYSRKTQYEDKWDEITLMCRGLITNSEGKIVSRCFKKFFNWEQLLGVNYKIPNEPFEITEKMDGQLGLLFWYDGEWILASRGSFTSIYAQKAWSMLQKYDYKKLTHDCTYIFEIIFKEGRIVCKYDFEDLILIGCINIPFGFEVDIHDPQSFPNLAGLRLVKKYDGINDFKTLKTTIQNDAEGYVIRFKSGFRMKIKGDEYCRLHSIITHISTLDIWRCLKDGCPIEDMLENVPDEFDKWVKAQIKSLKEMYKITDAMCQIAYLTQVNPTPEMTRKEVAMKVLQADKSLQGIFFNIYDGKDYSEAIWRKIRPVYSKPFNTNDDEDNYDK